MREEIQLKRSEEEQKHKTDVPAPRTHTFHLKMGVGGAWWWETPLSQYSEFPLPPYRDGQVQLEPSPPPPSFVKFPAISLKQEEVKP